MSLKKKLPISQEIPFTGALNLHKGSLMSALVFSPRKWRHWRDSPNMRSSKKGSTCCISNWPQSVALSVFNTGRTFTILFKQPLPELFTPLLTKIPTLSKNSYTWFNGLNWPPARAVQPCDKSLYTPPLNRPFHVKKGPHNDDPLRNEWSQEMSFTFTTDEKRPFYNYTFCYKKRTTPSIDKVVIKHRTLPSASFFFRSHASWLFVCGHRSICLFDVTNWTLQVMETPWLEQCNIIFDYVPFFMVSEDKGSHEGVQ